MSEQPVLRIEQVEKRFGLVEAVKGVSLEIARGEFFALLGPSGSGKTTLLRIVSGLETPNRGRVEIGGRDVTPLPPYLRRIGMVFQDFLLFPHKTVAENITFPLKMQGRGAAEQKEQLDWILDFVHMPELAQRYPHQLSGRSSAWRWPAAWSPDQSCSCSTNRSPTWTASCAGRWRSRSAAIRRSWRSPSST